MTTAWPHTIAREQNWEQKSWSICRWGDGNGSHCHSAWSVLKVNRYHLWAFEIAVQDCHHQEVKLKLLFHNQFFFRAVASVCHTCQPFLVLTVNTVARSLLTSALRILIPSWLAVSLIKPFKDGKTQYERSAGMISKIFNDMFSCTAHTVYWSLHVF